MPFDEAKAIHQMLVKLLHPDGAAPDEQARRTKLMQRVNAAYEKNDLATLKAIVREVMGESATPSQPPPPGANSQRRRQQTATPPPPPDGEERLRRHAEEMAEKRRQEAIRRAKEQKEQAEREAAAAAQERRRAEQEAQQEEAARRAREQAEQQRQAAADAARRREAEQRRQAELDATRQREAEAQRRAEAESARRQQDELDQARHTAADHAESYAPDGDESADDALSNTWPPYRSTYPRTAAPFQSREYLKMEPQDQAGIQKMARDRERQQRGLLGYREFRRYMETNGNENPNPVTRAFKNLCIGALYLVGYRLDE